MAKDPKTTINVHGTAIAIVAQHGADYISLTDIAKYRNPQDAFAIINNWMRSRSTIEFFGLWEELSNPDFKPLEFERFRTKAGFNSFVLTPRQWIGPRTRSRPTPTRKATWLTLRTPHGKKGGEA